MKKKKLSLLLLLIPFVVFSQSRIIKGKVTDGKTGEPIPVVSIVLKTTKIGVYSDFEGDFELDVKGAESGILTFGFLGYETKDVPFTKESTVINVSLDPSAEELDEIVITALGIKREQKSLTYSTQKVDVDDMKEAQTSNFLNALSGKAAGVQIVGSSTPTGSTRVVIRGLTSITGNNQPLYIIDGVALDSGQGDGDVTVWNGGNDIDYGSPLSNINPDDIGSIQILKGANAAALYGSRASNGVVLITTKKGVTDNSKVEISLNSNFSMISNREYPDYQYAYGSGASGRLALNISGIDQVTGLPFIGFTTRAYGMPFLGQQVIGYNGEVTTYQPYTNNVKELYKVGTVKTNTIAVSKGNEQGSIRFSYNNTIGDHVMKGMEQQLKNNFTLRIAQNLSSKVKTNMTVLYTNFKVDNRMYQNGSERNPANNYMYITPDMSQSNLLPYKDLNNNAIVFNGPFNNPYWNLNENSNADETNNLVANVSLNWEILRGLNLSTKVNGAINVRDDFQFNNKGAAYDPDGLLIKTNNNRQNWNYEAILNYKTKIKDFSIVSIAGVNRFDLRFSNQVSIINSLIVRDIISLFNTQDIPIIN
jgi:TonB-linked SusC/RagA family outer membrane protein